MDHALIVSNNRVVSKRLDIILTLEGYACLPVYTSDEALNMILKEKFNLILIDEQIGKKGYDEILNHLLLNKFDLPIITIRKKIKNSDGWRIQDRMKNIFELELKKISTDFPNILEQMLNSLQLDENNEDERSF